MTPKNRALSILLIIQLAVLAIVYWPSNEQAAPKTIFFADLSNEQIKGLTITDEEQTSITMSLSNERWQIQQGGYPGNPKTINAILDKIISLQSSRLVTTTKSSQVRLKVAADVFNRKVEMQLADGTTKSFFLGTAPNNKTIHFRMDGQNQVYQVKDLASWELQTDQKSWWQTNYIDMPEDELEAVKITNAQGPLTIKKGAEEKWLLAETTDAQKVSQEEIQKLITSISKISLAEYLDQKQQKNLGAPICTLEYSSNSEPFSLEIWPEDEESGLHTAKATNSDFFVTIRAYLLEDILQAQPSKYLVKPEVPAEVSAPEK